MYEQKIEYFEELVEKLDTRKSKTNQKYSILK